MTHLFSPYKKICEVPLITVQQALISIFHRRGVPQCIKVDNGRPFGDPQRQIVPPLALWLIALGIRVIVNRPRTPQDNAKVERSQGVLANWTEYTKCLNRFELQVKLWEETDFHNLQYPVSRLGRKTRLETYPDLLKFTKTFNPQDFDTHRCLDFIAKGAWVRETSQNGQFSFWGQRYSIGVKFAKQRVSIKLDTTTQKWQVFDEKGNSIKHLNAHFDDDAIWNLNCPKYVNEL